MGLLSLFKKKQYDLDTLKGIEAIPVPAKKYNTGEPLKDSIYYVLQRKATEHKKAGRMDCAIACLRKSNELSDYAQPPLLTQKEYLRLIKYIELTGDHELAEQELEKLKKRHPEFWDKRISNLVGIQQALKKNKKWKNDFVLIMTSNTCPICRKYNRKVYSISGKSKKYPKLPSVISREGGACPNCSVSVNTYFDGTNTSI